MTPSEHAQRIRQIEFELEKADHGLAMPYDYQLVLALRRLLEQARRDADEAIWQKGWAQRLAHRRGEIPL